MTKPGYKTTEFWVTILTYLIGILNYSGVWNIMSNWHNGILVAAATGAYKVSRGLAKTAPLTINTSSVGPETPTVGEPTSTAPAS